MKAIKKPVTVRFRGPVTSEEVINTLEGPVTAFPGDFVLTGTKGERWPVKGRFFEENYEIDGAETCHKRPVVIDAEEMPSAFEVTVGWAGEPLRGNAGDFRVKYGPDDYGIVARDVFIKTYDAV